ncbi:DUF3911 family protein [Ectobacillus ponti]|uniref:DUF3911 family protein n=1 Tax=Ectobacillus ponti TaxID=2961894 RepID=A0AA42BSN7_9BACI|nr:DUF3911 family protein [Ectobacillus ponti]MCP8968638.1 DUF3911 family protein [Ectobacillus ponti]
MASLQVKGTKQEVLELLQLFQSLEANGLCTVELELVGEQAKPEAQRPERQTFEYVQEDQSRDFICQMLTAAYND